MKSFCHYLFQIILLLFAVAAAFAGTGEWTVQGKVFEKGTGRPLEGVTVYLAERDTESSITESDGGFTLSLKHSGESTLIAAGVGFSKSKPLKISVGQPTAPTGIAIYLEPIYSMTEVVVQADRNQDRTAKTIISGKELASVPGSAGDPLRGMQALPGITTSNDASSAPAIRGSGPQDNAYYIDFMPVGYLFHMGGMESVINPDLVEDFNIYASSFGPEYTDVTGGIVDVRLRNPRKDRLGGKVNLSLLEADFLVEGPVTPTQSFYFGARRSYIDLFLAKTGELDSGVNYQQFPQFYDYQGKYIWDLTPDNSLTLQTSGAEDQMELTFTDEADMVKHDPIIAGDLNMKMDYHSQGVLLASRISSRLTNKFGLSHLQTLMEEFLTQIGHVNIVTDSYYLRDHLSTVVGDNHEFLVGVEGGEVRFKLDMDMTKVMPSDFNADTDYTSSARFINNDSFASHWWDLALKDRWRVIDGWTLIVGGHGSYESYFGRYRLEPRVSTEIVPVKDTLITAGWGQYHQFPEGFQIIEGMGNRHLGYVNAEHYALGVEQRFKEGWSVKIEGYYKNLDDVVTPNLVENYSNDGSGTAYGSELLIKKNRIHDWSGWLAAGYSKTKRRNEVTGEEFPYSYDQPVIINLVYEWNFLPKWTVGAKWRYQSGAPFTPVNSTYTDSTGRIRPVYGELGSERLPDYHRLDLRIARDFLFNTWKIKAYLDIINAYDHKNIAGYEYNADYTDRAPITQLPLMPSIGITAEF